jgi:hypothetical protein
MKVKVLFASGLILAALVIVLPQAIQELRVVLNGYEEVPSISTPGSGELQARISNDEREISYALSYSNLESTVTQAHIHLGQSGVNGGISVFLCTNLGNGPAGTPPCPQSGGIGGIIRSADVIGPAAQGINPGEFAELIQALRAGKTYVNIHSTKYPAGEVRSQIDLENRHDNH